MKATLLYRHKARLHGRYVLEMTIHQIEKSTAYKDGIKFGLIFVDQETGRRVLMDNHHPKRPHIHLDQREIPYDYGGDEKLLSDFKALVWEHMGIRL